MAGPWGSQQPSAALACIPEQAQQKLRCSGKTGAAFPSECFGKHNSRSIYIGAAEAKQPHFFDSVALRNCLLPAVSSCSPGKGASCQLCLLQSPPSPGCWKRGQEKFARTHAPRPKSSELTSPGRHGSGVLSLAKLSSACVVFCRSPVTAGALMEDEHLPLLCL